jgi:glutamyl-tRNA synthetase
MLRTMIERGRFAPTPSGRLHIGSARTALAAALAARAAGGRFALRVEDLDGTRTREGMTRAMLEDLTWLGVRFDEGPERGPHEPYVQSARGALYLEALEVLRAQGLVYPCACSRREVEELARAPHGREPVYPGTCRDRAHDVVLAQAHERGRAAAWRFRAREGTVAMVDEIAGAYAQDVAREVGDFVVYRADGVAAYQLAVVVDDIAMEVTQVVRGEDLLASTPRQALLYEAFGARPPRWAHVGLVVNDQGQRLAKRDGALSIAALREAGVRAQALREALLDTLGAGPTQDRWTPESIARGALTLRALSERLPEIAPLIAGSTEG